MAGQRARPAAKAAPAVRAKTSAPKRAADKAMPAALVKRKQKARAKLPANPVASKAVDQDLAEWEGRARAAKTPIAKAHTQRVLDVKRRAYGRPARGRGR